ncbi:MAG: substrate-binding domain-containing protein [Spirochaetales bacterium]|nr:substrate-binding domain-containing protein [Spirochaetales bacterium]
MAIQKRPLIGFPIFDITGKYVELLWQGIILKARELDVNLCTYTDIHFYYNKQVPVKINNKRKFDGLIMATGPFLVDSTLEELCSILDNLKSIPMVTVGMKIRDIPAIVMNNEDGMRDAVSHLITVHKLHKIAFIRGPEVNNEAEDRYAGYLKALNEHGIPFNPELVAQGNFIPESGELAAFELFEKRKLKPEAIVCANDDMAIGAIRYLNSRNIRIPEDIYLTGFDDVDEVKFTLTPLTTVKQPIKKQGVLAVEMLYKILNGENVKDITLPSQLVVRNSCGCLSHSVNFLQNISSVRSERKPPVTDVSFSDIKNNIVTDILDTMQIDVAAHAVVEKQLHKMVDNFFAVDTKGSGRNRFIYELNKALVHDIRLKRDISFWNNILTCFRNHVLSMDYEVEEKIFLESLFHQARVLTGELMRLEQAYSRLDLTNNVVSLVSIIQNLITEKDISGLARSLVESLPLLGINRGYLALFDEPVIFREDHFYDLPEKCRLVTAFDQNGQKAIEGDGLFSSDAMLPEYCLGDNDRFNLVIRQVVYRNELFGLVLYEYGPSQSVIYQTLTIQIGSIIKNLHLLAAQKKAEEDLKKMNEELVAANEKLTDLDRLKSNFFANISHELRTPLTLLLGPLESIRSGEFGDVLDSNSEIFVSMYNNSSRLLSLINDLLDFSKIESGKMEMKKKRVNIDRLLKFYFSTIKSSFGARKISVEYKSECDGLIVLIDRGLIEKAFFNIISNAYKFTPDSGNIVISLKKNGDWFSISISDSGIGIPADKLETVFDRFTQLDGLEKRKYEGTGIGLAFAREIIEMHDGSIDVESTEGKGSVFTIKLPIGSTENIDAMDWETDHEEDINQYLVADIGRVEELPVKADARPGEKHMTVLVVDDNPDICRFLDSLLSRDYNVISAGNGREGLDLAVRERPDLIISDVMMPEMDGYELTRAIKSDERLKGIPVILLTAKAGTEMKVEGLESGADDYLSKPFNAKELRVRIKNSLEMKKLRDHLSLQKDILAEKKEVLEQLVKEQTKEIEREKNIAVKLRNQAEDQLEDFLLALASAIESKDKYTGYHVDRVAGYSRDIAQRLKLDPVLIREIYLGAIVHDVGKIGVRDSVLNNPGKLSAPEYEEMKRHPEIGKKLLERIHNIEAIVQIAYCHQERWDGKGYPRSLKGEEIPLAGRIVTIADYWDAITTDRPYRKAIPFKKALKIMEEERGGAFDPDIYDIFMNDADKFYMRYLSKDYLML